MAALPDQLVELVRNGGSVTVNARDYLPASLVEVARNCQKKSILTIRNAESILQAQRVEIARNGGGQVVFEL